METINSLVKTKYLELSVRQVTCYSIYRRHIIHLGWWILHTSTLSNISARWLSSVWKQVYHHLCRRLKNEVFNLESILVEIHVVIWWHVFIYKIQHVLQLFCLLNSYIGKFVRFCWLCFFLCHYFLFICLSWFTANLLYNPY